MNLLKKSRMVPFECVKKLLEMKGSSIEEMLAICQGEASELKEKATGLMQLGKQKRETGMIKFNLALAKIKNELDQAINEAESDEKIASDKIIEAQRLEKIIVTIS